MSVPGAIQRNLCNKFDKIHVLVNKDIALGTSHENKEDVMKKGHQLLMWIFVILALSAVLIYSLHNNSIDVDQQSDTVPIHLAGVANLLKTTEAISQKSAPKSEPVTAVKELEKTSNAPMDISDTELPRSISLSVSMRVYSGQENNVFWLPASRNNLDLYTLLDVNGMENQHLGCQGERICISPDAGFCIRSKKIRWHILNSGIESL